MNETVKSCLPLLRVMTMMVVFSPLCCVAEISLGQVDEFENGTTLNWAGGEIAPPQYVGEGGPTGQSDGYLKLTTDSFHLGTRNTNQWTGNYLSAGINTIEMDMLQLDDGEDLLQIRLLVVGPGGIFATTKRTPPLEKHRWIHYTFSLHPGDLVYVIGGTGDLTNTLSAVDKLLIRNDTEIPTLPKMHPPHVTAEIGIDNILASNHPEQLPQPIMQPTITFSTVNGDPTATFSISKLRTGSFYVLERKNNLETLDWEQRSRFSANDNTEAVSDTIPGSPQHFFFYRIRFDPTGSPY